MLTACCAGLLEVGSAAAAPTRRPAGRRSAAPAARQLAACADAWRPALRSGGVANRSSSSSAPSYSAGVSGSPWTPEAASAGRHCRRGRASRVGDRHRRRARCSASTGRRSHVWRPAPIGRATVPTPRPVWLAIVRNEVLVISRTPPTNTRDQHHDGPGGGDQRPQRPGDSGADPAAGIADVVEIGERRSGRGRCAACRAPRRRRGPTR